MSQSLRTLVALAMLCFVAGKPYTGNQCTGVVDFGLEDTTTISTIDGTIMIMFAAMPKWLTEECQNAARTAPCGMQYALHAQVGSGMCKSQWEQALQP